jgi:hypothetical protein
VGESGAGPHAGGGIAGLGDGEALSRTFSLNEAQMLLPVLEALLQRARESALKAAEIELEMQRLSHRIFLTGGLHVDITAAARRRAERDKASQETKDSLAEMEAIGVKVQDLQTGVLDFPCAVDGKIVMLCWRMGETAITHWHELEEGADARQPLDGRFGKTERLN